MGRFGHWAGGGKECAGDWAGRKLYITACEIQYTTSLSRYTIITKTSGLKRLTVHMQTYKGYGWWVVSKQLCCSQK